MKILVIDDNNEIHSMLKVFFENQGHTMYSALSASEGLKMLVKTELDAVLLDIRLPDKDGIEALKEIKRRHPLTEVIMLTGHASLEVAVEGMELGAFDYLMKPVDIDDLLYRIEDAYKKKMIQEKESDG